MTTDTLDTTILVKQWRPEYNTSHLQMSIEVDKRVAALQDFLKHMSLFAGITDTELKSLAKDFVPNRFRQGETIFHQGDPGQVLYLIQSGQVRIFVMGDEGRRLR